MATKKKAKTPKLVNPFMAGFTPIKSDNETLYLSNRHILVPVRNADAKKDHSWFYRGSKTALKALVAKGLANDFDGYGESEVGDFTVDTRWTEGQTDTDTCTIRVNDDGSVEIGCKAFNVKQTNEVLLPWLGLKPISPRVKAIRQFANDHGIDLDEVQSFVKKATAAAD